jgi:hypothetical protein
MLTDRVEALAEHVATNDHISIDDIFRIVGEEAELILIAILSLVSLALSPVPGNSLVFGVPAVALAIVYAFNIPPERLRLPFFSRPLSTEKWRPHMPTAIRYARRIEAFVKPRWPFAHWLGQRLPAGLGIAFMSLIVTAPIPFANIPGLIGCIALAIGTLQRDGLLLVLGGAMAAAHAAVLLAFLAWLF